MATPQAKDRLDSNSGCLTALRKRHQDKYRTKQPYHLTRQFWDTAKLGAILENHSRKNWDELQSSEQRRKIVHLLRTLGNPVQDWRALILHLQGDRRALSARSEAWKAMSGKAPRRVQYGRMPSKLSNATGYRYWRRRFRKLADQAEWIEQAQDEHRAQQLAEQNSQISGDSESVVSESEDSDSDSEPFEVEDVAMSNGDDPLDDLERAAEELKNFEFIDYSQFATDPMGIACDEAVDLDMEQPASSNEVDICQSDTDLPGSSTPEEDDDDWDPYDPFAKEFAMADFEPEDPPPGTFSNEFSSSPDFNFSDFDGSFNLDSMGLSEDEDESDESEDDDSDEGKEEEEEEAKDEEGVEGKEEDDDGETEDEDEDEEEDEDDDEDDGEDDGEE